MNRLILCFLVAVCSLFPSAARVSAQPKDDRVAATFIAEAERAYGDKDFTAAILNYQQAYGLNRNPAILLIIAHVYDRALRQPKLASTYYQLYLASVPDRDPTVSAELTVAERTARLAKLRLATTPSEGLQAIVDGSNHGTTPISEPIVLSPGTHQLSLSKDGRLAYETTLNLRPGDQLVAVDLTNALKAPANNNWWLWSITGIAAGTSIAWGTTGAIALARSDRDIALTADVLLGVAVSTTVTSIILWVTQ